MATAVFAESPKRDRSRPQRPPSVSLIDLVLFDSVLGRRGKLEGLPQSKLNPPSVCGGGGGTSLEKEKKNCFL